MLLLGPGRWGTSTPSLGVPVRFAEINHVCALVEIAHSGMGVMPELSFGTHFFQDLVEAETFYIALVPGTEGVVFNEGWFEGQENQLSRLLPESVRYEGVVRVQDMNERPLYLMADIMSQRVLCFISEKMDQ